MKVLMTGAGGALGRAMRLRWQGRFELLRLSDVAPMAAGAGALAGRSIERSSDANCR